MPVASGRVRRVIATSTNTPALIKCLPCDGTGWQYLGPILGTAVCKRCLGSGLVSEREAELRRPFPQGDV